MKKVTSLFVQADIDTEVAGFPVTGNVGVRYVQTDQNSQKAQQFRQLMAKLLQHRLILVMTTRMYCQV